MKSKFVVCVPFTGLGLYNGFRGNRWLRNRIKIFCQFVLPSLKAQTDQDFVLWIAWRREEKTNIYVRQLFDLLQAELGESRVVFTYSGIPFWDDKLEDEPARDKLLDTLKLALPDLMEPLSDCDEVIWLLQPSDDCYASAAISSMKGVFALHPDIQAITFDKGYICNYNTKEILEYNPNTNPPFFCIRFPRNTFFDPGKHMTYTGPYKSHEYIGDKLKLAHFSDRGFLVGTHGENISTHFNHPFGGEKVDPTIFAAFGLQNVPPLTLPISYRKTLMRRLPYRWQRKLRYLIGERFVNKFYEFLRN